MGAQQEFILEFAWMTLLKQAGRRTVMLTRMSIHLRTTVRSQLGWARSAGDHQWGMDAGNHQDGWDPYTGLPSHWNHENHDEGDSD